MNFQEAVFLLEQSQHFPKTATLERMQVAVKILGHPERDLKFIHIAGTNGKGSTGALIKVGLEQNGYRVGRFISPHLMDITERISIGKSHISQNDFANIFELLAENREVQALGLSYFEQLALMALLYFQKTQPDYIIWETGLGGRLDATNVVNPKIVVITAIGLDHVKLLGGDLVSIAKEKAAIIKPKAKAVIAIQKDNLEKVFLEKAKDVGTEAIFARDFLPVKIKMNGLKPSNTYIPQLGFAGILPLLGRHQGDNALTALLTLRALGIDINKSIGSGLFADTIWPGRLQYFPSLNLLVDGAHNEQAMETFTAFFRETKVESQLIFACITDKDYITMVNQLDGIFKQVYLPRIANKRSIEPEKLALLFQKTPCQVCESLEQALKGALNESSLTTLVGSLYLVGECLQILEHKFDIKDLQY